MRKLLWELNRRQQMAAVAAIVVVAFAAIAIYALVGFRATDCVSQKSALYESWNNSLPLLTVQFEPNVSEQAARGFLSSNGLRLRQSNSTAAGIYDLVDAPADKPERVRLACAWEQDPRVRQVYLVRPLFKKGDAA